MALILFENGKKVGEISDWVRTERLPQTKTVLGKEIVTQKLKDQCTFASPKVLGKKTVLTLVADGKQKLVLADIKVKSGTFVTATIAEQLAL